MEEPKPNPVVDGELQRPMVVVIMLLGVFLSLEQAIADIGQEGVAVPEKHIHRLRTRGPCSIRQQSRRGLPVDNLERRCAERGVV